MNEPRRRCRDHYGIVHDQVPTDVILACCEERYDGLQRLNPVMNAIDACLTTCLWCWAARR